LKKPKKFYTYLICSSLKNKKLISYVGYTDNIKKRLEKHNTGKGAKFTRGKKWFLIFKKTLQNKSSAMKFEYRLKKDRKLRKKLIKKFQSRVVIKN